MRAAVLLLVLLCSSVALAHFKFYAPTPGRGFEDDPVNATGSELPVPEDQAPCGTFNTPTTPIPFTLNNSTITFEVLDGTGPITFGFASNPNNIQSTLTAISTTYSVTGTTPTETPITIALTLPSSAAGKTGTIQAVYASDFTFYQCLDVTVASSASISAIPSAIMALFAAVSAVFLL